MSNFKQIFGSTNRSSNTIWMSSTDLMSGLMIVFMFIAIAYMVFVERKAEKTYEIAMEWQRSKLKLVKALHDTFDKDLMRWDAEIDDDSLSIRFISPKILFEPGKKYLKPRFQQILNEFFPRYIKLLNNFKSIVSEIRIEGHTSKEWKKNTPEMEAYLKNMNLSQGRTRSVLEFCLKYLAHKIPNEIDWARNKITANGLSSSQVFFTNDKYDKKKSRRVEFKVRTNSEERIDQILSKRLNGNQS